MSERTMDQARVEKLEGKVAALGAECPSWRRWLRDLTVAVAACFVLGMFASIAGPWAALVGVVVLLLSMLSVDRMLAAGEAERRSIRIEPVLNGIRRVELEEFLREFQHHLASWRATHEQAVSLDLLRQTRFLGLEEAILGFKSAPYRMACGVGEKGKPCVASDAREAART